MSVSLMARIGLARATYAAAVLAARELPTRAAWARLLRAAENLREALAERDRAERGIIARSNDVMPAVPDKPVMVVEDDAVVRDCVVQFLSEEGFSLVEARNGSEALHLLREEHVTPAVILLDLMMPVMSGWQFREEQLADASISSIPVIVTAMESHGICADALVHKPFNVDELLNTISRVTR